MAPIHLGIQFDKSSREYYAGEVLNGNVILKLKKAMPIIEIKVKLKGECKVSWSETEGSGDDERTVWYTNYEKYLDQKVILFKPSQQETFNAGESSFPFSYILSKDLPESFKGVDGKVTYKARATVESSERIGLFSFKCEESEKFTVHALVPLPPTAYELTSIFGSKNLPFCCDYCCCISSGKISATLTIDKGGYMPGEEISFNSEISNKSMSQLDGIMLVMKQKITYKAKHGHTTTSITKVPYTKQAYQNGLPGGQDMVWPVSVRVPCSYPPTNLGTCKIIDISYYLELEIGEDTGCCAPDVHFRIKFFMGCGEPPLTNSIQCENGYAPPYSLPMTITEQPIGFKQEVLPLREISKTKIAY